MTHVQTRISYSRESRDYDCFVTIDGAEEYIGSATTYHDGDVTCNEYVYNYFLDNHTPETAAQVLARPAEVVEVVKVTPTHVVIDIPGLTPHVITIQTGYTVELVERSGHYNDTMALLVDGYWQYDLVMCKHLSGRPELAERCQEALRLVQDAITALALPGAPLAPEIDTTPLAPVPSDAGQDGATEATQPAASALDCGCLDPSICWCGAHPMDAEARAIYRDLNIRYTAESIAIEALSTLDSLDPTSPLDQAYLDALDGIGPWPNSPTPLAVPAAPDVLRRRALALLDAWKECGVATEMDAALAQLDHALSAPPTPESVDGQRIWDAYRDRTLAPVLRDADPAARQRMASAAAKYLSGRWGRAVPAGAILNNFEWLIRNAA